MYYYIFDAFCSQPKYKKLIGKINIQLEDLDISGEKVFLNPIRTVENTVKEAILNKRQRNIVVVGDDKTASSAVNAITRLKKKVAFGFIPIINSRIADVLKMPVGEESCKHISRRRLKRFDLGKMQNNYFLSTLTINSENIRNQMSEQGIKKYLSGFKKNKTEETINLAMDFGNFNIKTEAVFFAVLNGLSDDLKYFLDEKNLKLPPIKTDDGYLDLIIVTHKLKSYNRDHPNAMNSYDLTYFRINKVYIRSERTVSYTFDNSLKKNLPVVVEVVPQGFIAITGKND